MPRPGGGSRRRRSASPRSSTTKGTGASRRPSASEPPSAFESPAGSPPSPTDRPRHSAFAGVPVVPGPPAPPRPAGSSRDPIARIVIDGRNVQRALERGSAHGSMPTAALVARIRAAFSPPIEVELILDGHAGGSPQGRVAPGLTVSFSRGRSADEVIADRAGEALFTLGPAGAWSVVVVTDDREVRDQARRNGVRVERTAWLTARLAQRIGTTTGATGGDKRGTAIGAGRPPRSPTIGNRSRG